MIIDATKPMEKSDAGHSEKSGSSESTFGQKENPSQKYGEQGDTKSNKDDQKKEIKPQVNATKFNREV